MSFKYETIKYKIKKGDQGFGIALGGGGSKRNEVTGETGIFISDVLPGPAFGNLVVGDIILKINGIDMTKAEKPQATTILKGSSVADLLIKRRMSTALGGPAMMNQYGMMANQMGPNHTMQPSGYDMTHGNMSHANINPQMTQQMTQQMMSQQQNPQFVQAQMNMPQHSVYSNSQPQMEPNFGYQEDPNMQMASIMRQNPPKEKYISDSEEEYRSKSKSRKSYDHRSSSEERKKKKKKKKRYSSSSRSSSRGSSLDRELGQIKIRDDYVTIPVKAHEPKKMTIRKKAGESFGMKLGTRVFVQGLTKDGLADKEGLNTEDLILSINGTETDSMTIPEVLAQLVNVDLVELEVQQVAGGTVTLPADVLNGGMSGAGSKTDSKSSKSENSKSKKSHKKEKRRSSSEDYYKHRSDHDRRYHSKTKYDSRYEDSKYNDPYVSQKSTHV